MPNKIAFATYETPFAPCGGIAAVMAHLPQALRQSTGLDIVTITPYHHQIEKTTSLKTDLAGQVNVPWDSTSIPVHIHRYQDHSFFLAPEDRRFFAGDRHPYDLAHLEGGLAANLSRDALFFGAAVVAALPTIAPNTTWMLLLQDWEAATTALVLAGRDHAHRIFLTLHNSYDSEPLGDAHLRRAGINPAHCPGPDASPKASVLERALPLVADPIFTVSRQFALDLTEEVLQRQVVADHLQEGLKGRLVGVDNGPFSDLAIDPDLVDAAGAGDFAALKAWKEARRAEALAALEVLATAAERPVWGDLTQFDGDEEVPWFMLAGRDDPRQKGYDVAVQAIAHFLEDGGEGRFLCFPIPGDEGMAGLGFLRGLAERFPTSVLALPFLFREGFIAVLRGSTYGLMPSLYEPFGMANEFYANGTVGIGRATGGIAQQIVPLQTATAFGPAVRARAARWHAASGHPTGLLFREPDDMPTAVVDWQGLTRAAYDRRGGHPDRIEERRQYPLFRDMADGLHNAIADGAYLYRTLPHLYYRMLAAGVHHIQDTFSWERAAGEYARHIAPKAALE